MPWSKLDIINLAFNVLNKSSVNSVSSAGEFSDAADRAYDMLMPAEIAIQSWRFATKIQGLNLLVDPAPLSWWRYQLQLPSDYLAAVRTYPRFDFQIFGDKIYANAKDIKLEYRYVPNPTALPAYFVHYFVLKLAAWFADAVAQDDNLSRSLEAKSIMELQKALFCDSQSHPTPSMANNPIVGVRSGCYGGNWGYGYGGY